MTKLSLTAAGILAVVTALFAPALIARTQSASRFEHLRLAPYATRVQVPGRVEFRNGYRACVAAAPDWTCREFAPTESSDAALSTAVATLGSEGWELVAAVRPEPESSYPTGLTYLFKRSAP